MFPVDGNETTSNSLGKKLGSTKYSTAIWSQLKLQLYKGDNEARAAALQPLMQG